MGKFKTKLKSESNPTVYNRLNRVKLRCAICPPHKGENASRKPKHGVKKSKNKDHRK